MSEAACRSGLGQFSTSATVNGAIGQSITIIIPTERRNEETEILARLSRGDTIEHFETQRVTKDGRRVAISLTASPVRNRHRVVIGASKIARDISDRVHADGERARLLASERAARAQAEKANRAKDELLATASHELRAWLHSAIRRPWLLPPDLACRFVLADRHEPGVPRMIFARPLEKLDLSHEDRLQPASILHLRCGRAIDALRSSTVEVEPPFIAVAERQELTVRVAHGRRRRGSGTARDV
jgi:hypothetical protein